MELKLSLTGEGYSFAPLLVIRHFILASSIVKLLALHDVLRERMRIDLGIEKLHLILQILLVFLETAQLALEVVNRLFLSSLRWLVLRAVEAGRPCTITNNQLTLAEGWVKLLWRRLGLIEHTDGPMVPEEWVHSR